MAPQQFIMLGIFVSAIIGIFAGRYGETKKIGYLEGFLSCLFFSPIIGMLFIIASEKHDRNDIKIKKEKIVAYIIFAIICIIFLVVINHEYFHSSFGEWWW